MKKIALFCAICAIAMTTLISGCSHSNTTTACTSGTMTVNLNGTAFAPTSFQNTLLKATSGGVDAKRFDLRATNSAGKTFIISISDYRDGKSGDGMRTGTYYLDATANQCNANNTACIGVLITYDNNVYLPVNGTGSVIITSCDATAHLISGTISGTVQDFNGNNFTITGGTFTNCCYSVLN